MQFSPELRERVADGTITVSYRLWSRPKVKVGGIYRSGGSSIEIDDIELVPFSSVTDEDLAQTGDDDRESLRRRTAHAGPVHDDTPVYRIEFHLVGPAGRRSVTTVPATASDHPPTWKFGFPIYHPPDLAAWRAWLATNHDIGRGVWVATWRQASGQSRVGYEDLVEEALCFGWIDSTVNILDDERGLQLMTPRKPKSGWTRLNRQRVAAMERAGRMTDAGRQAVAAAKANGWWTIYDPVEDLIEPDELAAALDASPTAREAWDRFPPSARKQMLWSIVSAARPETRASRIAKIVSEAERGRRAAG